MLQVSKRSWSGRIKYCYLHDILRTVAIRKAKEDNFLVVYTKSDTNSTDVISATTRRLALANEFGNSELPIDTLAPKLRSLIYFGNDFPKYNELRMARVLHFENEEWNLVEVGHKWLKHLTNLRYFRFYYPRQKVPSLFWNNKMLSYVKMTYDVMGPRSSANLENLVTLKGVVVRAEWAVKLPRFPLIRKLGVRIVPGTDWEALSNSLSKLEYLYSLSVHTELGKELSHPFFTPAFKNYKNLHSLFVSCEWPGRAVGDCSLFPPNLAKLTLVGCFFERDPMPELEKLPCLMALRLLSNAYRGEQLTCSSGGFRHLQQLKLVYQYFLEGLKIEEGAMPKLNKLRIKHCPKLQMLPDLQHLTKLRELKFAYMSKEFCSRLEPEGVNRHKIQHVPSIIIEH